MGKAYSSILFFYFSLHLVFPFVQLWVFVMISKQSFFIAGLENPDEAKASAFGACMMFLGTFGLSVIGIFWDSKSDKEAVQADDTPEGYVLTTGDVPEYGSRLT